MSTVIGNSDFKFEKSTLKVSFCWKFNEHKFGEYLEFNERCKSGISSTEKIRFESGFLAFTNHYMQCFITYEDCNMYTKIYLEDVDLPSEFTNYDLSPPRVGRKFDGSPDPSNGTIVNDALKTNLITKRFFTEEDFEEGKSSKVYWLFWSNNCYTKDGYSQILKTFNGEAITLNFEFDYCFWNKIKKGMHLSKAEDENQSAVNVPEKQDAVLHTKEFLFSPRFSDFTIECGNKSFPTHRNIIASKSPVFSAMLEQPLKEMKEGRLVIEDFESDAVEEFIRFIYTGSANVDEYATELFKLSNKYEIADLKLVCEATLITEVNEENLAETHELGKLYNSEKLKDKCYSFFKSKRSILLKTTADADKFSDFMFRFALE